MKRTLTLVAAMAAGGLIAYLYLAADEVTESDVHRAFARAKAYYLNETSADYRRARLELEAFAAQLDGSVAYHLDMALIDLQEINYRVQDQDRLLSESAYDRLLRSALAHLDRAREIDPTNDSVSYNLARTYKKLAPRAENEEELLERVEQLLRPLTAHEPPDSSTLLLYGNLLWDKRDAAGALAAYERIEEMGSDYVPESIFFVALNKKERVLRRTDPTAADALKTKIDELFPEKPKTTEGALERGRYTEFLDIDAMPPTTPEPRAKRWEQVTSRAGLPAMGAPRFFAAPDLDGDCARDLIMNGTRGMQLLRNHRNASFQDLTADAGLPADFPLAAAAVGDLDGDARCDLVVGGPRGLRIFLNHTDEDEPSKWRFLEISKLPDGTPLIADRTAAVRCLALWDFDHDGDLDLFVGGRSNYVLRLVVEQPVEGGKYLRYEDVTAQLGMHGPPASAVLVLDVDDDQDVDLCVAGPKGNAWFDNQRQLRFERRELPAGQGLGAADVDNDLDEEVRVGDTVYKWTGGDWKRLYRRAALLDLDADGVIDSDPLAPFKLKGALRRAVDADLNRDGSRDLLLLTEGQFDLYLSQPGRPAGWIDVQPRGLKTNEFGIGTRIKLFAGDLRIGATCRDGLVNFGLGHRAVVDALMIRWSNGVEQGVVTPPVAQCNVVDEREGEIDSCPWLYAFDGAAWAFVIDCQSGTPLGLPYADGKYLPPRPNETVFVPGRMLRPVAGTVRLEVAEELRELLFLDQVVLRAIDHPRAVRPVLNEGFKVFRFPEFKVYGLDDLRPPLAARDHKGRDILPLIARRDGKHAVVWKKLDSRYKGLAYEWSIVLDFGDLSKAKRILFVMDGWVEYPTASASIAASRSKTVHFKPPVVEVIGADSEWMIADKDPGFPAGKGKAVLVDLTGKFRTKDGRIRITSTQRLHWDAFQISTGPDRPVRLTALPLVKAEHRFRGVGRRIDDPAGELPWRYSHDELETFVGWDQQPAGMLTRYGDVKALVATIDDRYPVLAAGDVLALAFDATGLPPLAEGWVRDYCFTTEGWVKDADPNQAVRERVGPLPFHGMSTFPYDETKESHPHPDFVEEWFTRPARTLVDPAALAPKPWGPGGVQGSAKERKR